MIKTAKKLTPTRVVDAIRQEPLPYEPNALAPFISSRTLNYHYGKHHKAYVEKTRQLAREMGIEGMGLQEIILDAARSPEKRKLFNNAAQAWNHDFYWKSMRPKGGGKPGQEILKLIKNSYDGFEDFKTKFTEKAVNHFASGWVWLIIEERELKIVDLHDAENPLVYGQKPILTMDIWEHAYYLDYQNQRPEYVKMFLDHLVNWDFAESLL